MTEPRITGRGWHHRDLHSVVRKHQIQATASPYPDDF
jgi:hypothetical protein